MWQNWAYARHYDGIAIPGARTWTERAQRMMQSLLFRKVSEETTSEDGKTFITHEPAGWAEPDIASAFKIASDLMRREAGEPPNNTPPNDDWREQARRAGFDPDEAKQIVQQALMEYSIGHNLVGRKRLFLSQSL